MESTRDVGILFADIVGSTRMYEMLGDEVALSVVNACFDAMADCVAGQGGQVVKTIGDALMASFDTAPQALSAAMQIRRRIAALPPVPGIAAQVRARVRVGLHFGPALFDGDDYFGDTVNLAARMAGLASPGQILTTGDLLDRLPVHLRSLASEFAEIEVKGRHLPVRIARVSDDAATSENTQVRFEARVPTVPPVEAALTLTFAGRTWTAPPGTRRIVCGREAGCDILLTGALASRQHATIELRRDKVILIDHSTNGTVLLVAGERPVHLMREEFGLIRAGTIVFGRPEAADADTLAFTIG